VESICEHEEYNIFELELQGWSESVYENITDYDEVFEELYYKYKDTVSLAPELKLVCMVAGSAWMFHMSRNMFGKVASKMPEVDEVLARNPELRRQVQDAAADLAQQKGLPMPPKRGGSGLLSFAGQVLGGGLGAAPPPMPKNRTRPAPPPAANEEVRRPPPPPIATRQPRPQATPPRQRGPPGPPGLRAPPMPRPPGPSGRQRQPMEDPDDVDGLLNSLRGTPQSSSANDAESEIDLSAIDNYDDLRESGWSR